MESQNKNTALKKHDNGTFQRFENVSTINTKWIFQLCKCHRDIYLHEWIVIVSKYSIHLEHMGNIHPKKNLVFAAIHFQVRTVDGRNPAPVEMYIYKTL